MKTKNKLKQIMVLLLAAALLTLSVHLDGVAAESIVSEATIEQIEASETEERQKDANAEEENKILILDETVNNNDDQNDIEEIESDLDETTEMQVQEGTQLEAIETEQQEETQTENVTSEPQEELQTEYTEKEAPKAPLTEATEKETPEGVQTESTEEEAPEGIQTENVEEEPKVIQTENTEEESQEETEETAYAMLLNGGEEPLQNTADNEREFALQNGSADITSGKFRAVLAHITLPEELDNINNEDYVKSLNPSITGADGNANAYFKNLSIIAENKEGDTVKQYQLVGDVKAEAPTGAYTVTMTASGKSDTATFAIVEKGIESLKIKGIPSVVSSEKKVSIKPILEINGDPTGKDKAVMPKNKKIVWEIVGVEGVAAPPSLQINPQNGTITVNANDIGTFRIKATTTDNKYTDAEGNPISVTSENVEVASANDQRLESLADCAIVLVNDPDPAKAKLLHQNGKTADMHDLDGANAYIKIQRADGTFVSAESYVIKANNKAFRIGADASATCILTKPIATGKTLIVTLTATLVNGKKEQPLKGQITVQSATAGNRT